MIMATKAILDSKINEVKNTHVSGEVTKLDTKINKNSSDILGFESRPNQKEDTLNDLEREISSF